MLKPLLKVIPALSGNIKLACELNNFVKVDNNTYKVICKNAKLAPLYSESFQKLIDVNLLSSSWEYDVCNMYKLYSDIFYKDTFKYDKNNLLYITDITSLVKDRNVDFEFGCKRISYEKNGKQFAFFAPIYCDNVNDLPDSFDIDITLTLPNGNILNRKIVIDLTEQKSNYLHIYLKRYFSKIDDTVIFMKPNAAQAVYYGVNVKTGGLNSFTDNIISKLYTQETTINSFDACICEGFKRNNMIIRQTMPLSFYFNISDMFSVTEQNIIKYSTLHIKGNYVKNDKPLTFYMFDDNYNSLSQKTLVFNNNLAKFEYIYKNANTNILTGITGITENSSKGLNTVGIANYAHSNKITKRYSRWKLKYSPDSYPYFTNNNYNFSKNQGLENLYYQYPQNYYSTKAKCEIKNDVINLLLPIGNNITDNETIDNSKYYSSADPVVSKYKLSLDNYIASWFDLTDNSDLSSIINETNWADVHQDNKIFYKGLLYNFNDIYNVIGNSEKINKFAILLHINDTLLYSRETASNLVYSQETIEHSENLQKANIYCKNIEILDNTYFESTNTLYGVNETREENQNNSNYKNNQYFTYNTNGLGKYVDINDIGLDYYEVNKYYAIKNYYYYSNNENIVKHYITSIDDIFKRIYKITSQGDVYYCCDNVHDYTNLGIKKEDFIEGYELLDLTYNQLLDENGTIREEYISNPFLYYSINSNKKERIIYLETYLENETITDDTVFLLYNKRFFITYNFYKNLAYNVSTTDKKELLYDYEISCICDNKVCNNVKLKLSLQEFIREMLSSNSEDKINSSYLSTINTNKNYVLQNDSTLCKYYFKNHHITHTNINVNNIFIRTDDSDRFYGNRISEDKKKYVNDVIYIDPYNIETKFTYSYNLSGNTYISNISSAVINAGANYNFTAYTITLSNIFVDKYNYKYDGKICSDIQIMTKNNRDLLYSSLEYTYTYSALYENTMPINLPKIITSIGGTQLDIDEFQQTLSVEEQNNEEIMYSYIVSLLDKNDIVIYDTYTYYGNTFKTTRNYMLLSNNVNLNTNIKTSDNFLKNNFELNNLYAYTYDINIKDLSISLKTIDTKHTFTIYCSNIDLFNHYTYLFGATSIVNEKFIKNSNGIGTYMYSNTYTLPKLINNIKYDVPQYLITSISYLPYSTNIYSDIYIDNKDVTVSKISIKEYVDLDSSYLNNPPIDTVSYSILSGDNKINKDIVKTHTDLLYNNNDYIFSTMYAKIKDNAQLEVFLLYLISNAIGCETTNDDINGTTKHFLSRTFEEVSKFLYTKEYILFNNIVKHKYSTILEHFTGIKNLNKIPNGLLLYNQLFSDNAKKYLNNNFTEDDIKTYYNESDFIWIVNSTEYTFTIIIGQYDTNIGKHNITVYDNVELYYKKKFIKLTKPVFDNFIRINEDSDKYTDFYLYTLEHKDNLLNSPHAYISHIYGDNKYADYTEKTNIKSYSDKCDSLLPFFNEVVKENKYNTVLYNKYVANSIYPIAIYGDTSNFTLYTYNNYNKVLLYDVNKIRYYVGDKYTYTPTPGEYDPLIYSYITTIKNTYTYTNGSYTIYDLYSTSTEYKYSSVIPTYDPVVSNSNELIKLEGCNEKIYNKYKLNVYNDGKNVYGFYLINIDISNINSIFNIVDIYSNVLKYFTHINGIEIVNNHRTLTSLVPLLLPIMHYNITNIMYSIPLLVKQYKSVINKKLKYNPQTTSIKQIKETNASDTDITLYRYFDNIVPYLISTNNIYTEYILKCKTEQGVIPVKSGDIYYNDIINIYKYPGIRIYDNTDNYITTKQIEYKYYNDNQFILLEPTFTIHITENATISQVIEYQKDEIIQKYFINHVNKNRKHEIVGDDILFLFKKYNVLLLSNPTNLNGNNEKLYSVSYKFNLK